MYKHEVDNILYILIFKKRLVMFLMNGCMAKMFHVYCIREKILDQKRRGINIITFQLHLDYFCWCMIGKNTENLFFFIFNQRFVCFTKKINIICASLFKLKKVDHIPKSCLSTSFFFSNRANSPDSS